MMNLMYYHKKKTELRLHLNRDPADPSEVALKRARVALERTCAPILLNQLYCHGKTRSKTPIRKLVKGCQSWCANSSSQRGDQSQVF